MSVTGEAGRLQSFGDAYLELVASDLRVRLMYERGKKFVEIAAPDKQGPFAGLPNALSQLGIQVNRGPCSSYDDAIQELLAHRAELPGVIDQALEETRRRIMQMASEIKKGRSQ